MDIDVKKYKLSIKNYIPIDTQKNQIIIGNTLNDDMRHYIGWTTKLNGNYKKTAPFTISRNGEVYQHFNPKYFSKFFGNNNDLNTKSIVILLENYGYLFKNHEKNVFITWNGDIYKQQDLVVEKRWRGYQFWAEYTEKQLESLVELVCFLCDRFNIPLSVIGHNTKVFQLEDFKGVLYKSNLESYYSDPNPNLDYEKLKTKIENYEREY
jgi:N-acetyl-anhydromuramyl-L-alanine amidase AmpD